MCLLFSVVFIVFVVIIGGGGEQRRGHRGEREEIIGWRLEARGESLERTVVERRGEIRHLGENRVKDPHLEGGKNSNRGNVEENSLRPEGSKKKTGKCLRLTRSCYEGLEWSCLHGSWSPEVSYQASEKMHCLAPVEKERRLSLGPCYSLFHAPHKGHLVMTANQSEPVPICTSLSRTNAILG